MPLLVLMPEGDAGTPPVGPTYAVRLKHDFTRVLKVKADCTRTTKIVADCTRVTKLKGDNELDG